MVRQFVVGEGREQEFEALFAPEGRWTRLLEGFEGYIQSKLQRRDQVGTVYKVFDIWKAHYYFEASRRQHGEELKRFGEMVRAEGIVVSEALLGAYYDSEDEDMDEGPLTPA